MTEVTKTNPATAAELLTAFETNGFNRFWREYDIEIYDEGFTGDFEFDGVNYYWEVVHQSGGGEGGGEYCESVIQFSADRVKLPGFIKVTYSYYSYESFVTDYAEAFAVEAKEKLITVYE